jgi:purine-binding chemotaxis protein CheW
MSETTLSEAALYLTFKLGDEVFSIDVAQVREVLELSTITKVPQAPEFMRGVINVRGSVIPVVDLRRKFGMTRTEETVFTRVIVMDLELDGETTVLGAMADSVHEVIELDPERIEEPPKIGSRWRTEFIKGIGKRDEEFIIILDIDRVFSTDELALVEATGGQAAPEEEVV